jgi:hypothetical protein
MAKTVERIALPATAPGTDISVEVHRYGTPGARPKVYIQGGLHADELPGLLTADRLLHRLDGLAGADRVAGEIIVVPVANPLGLGQEVLGSPVGRFDLAGSGNFNRHYPDLTDSALDILDHRLPPAPEEAVAAVREALRQALAEQTPNTLADHLRHTLLGLAIDADVVLDLHCDTVAPLHLYLGTPLWPRAEALARYLGAELVLLAEVSGGHPFDEACSAPWWQIKQRLGADGEHLPPACLASTVELRGEADATDALACQDAEALVAFLGHEGVIVDNDHPAPPPLVGQVRPLEGVGYVRAPVPGIPLVTVGLGDRVQAGQRVAELVRPGETAKPVLAEHDGTVWSIARPGSLAHAGSVLVKTVAEHKLDGKAGQLLTAR